MIEYIVINGETHAVNTESEIKAACRALSAAGINSAPVWRSPLASIEYIRENGDPDAFKTSQVVLADSDVDPVENGTATGWVSVAGGWQCPRCRSVDRCYAPHKHECKKHGACAKLVEGHQRAVLGGPIADIPSWKTRHLQAWKRPRKGGERAVKLAIEAFAAYADDYYDSFETEIAGDGYFADDALNMLKAINASLTMGFKSDLDSGAVHRLLADLARMSGFNPDDM